MNSLKKCRYGLMMYNSRDVWVGRSLALYGEFSENEVSLFRNVINDGDWVFDIGANIGCHTLAFSQIVGKTGRVFAYEPVRTNFYTLAGNIALNNIFNVYPHQVAVGEKVGLLDVPELDVNRTLNFGGIELKNDYSKNVHYKTQVVSIDEIQIDKIDFMKIDVEGMEYEVLCGAKNSLEKHKPALYVESDREENNEKILKFLKENNYEVYLHDTELYNAENFEDNSINVLVAANEKNEPVPIISRNLLCLHKEGKAKVDFAKFTMQKI